MRLWLTLKRSSASGSSPDRPRTFALLVAHRDDRHELRRSQLASLDAKCHGPAGRHAKRVTIHLPRFGQARIDGHRRADRGITRRPVDLWIISHGERHRKRGTAGQVHKHLTHGRAGVPQVYRDFLGTERRLDQLSAPSAQRKHVARIGVGTNFQTIEIGASASKSEHLARRRNNRRLEERRPRLWHRVRATAASSLRAITLPLASRISSSGSIADPQRRASTSITRFSPALALRRNMSRSGPRNVPFSVNGGGRQRLRRLHAVAGVGKCAGLRFVLGEFRKRADREKLDIRNALARDDPDRVDADGKVRDRLDQERRVATLGSASDRPASARAHRESAA